MIIGIHREDGGLSVMTFVEGKTLSDVPKEIAKWESVSSYKAARWEEITEYPPRLYRNAYELGDGKPVINMVKARDVHRAQLRQERVAPLAALDVEYQRADELGDLSAKQAIAAEKQKYRDLPADPRIEAARTSNELAALTMDELLNASPS